MSSNELKIAKNVNFVRLTAASRISGSRSWASECRFNVNFNDLSWIISIRPTPMNLFNVWSKDETSIICFNKQSLACCPAMSIIVCVRARVRVYVWALSRRLGATCVCNCTEGHNVFSVYRLWGLRPKIYHPGTRTWETQGELIIWNKLKSEWGFHHDGRFLCLQR